MKKQSIAQYLCIGMAAFLFMACSQEEEAEKVNVSVPLRVMINNGQSSLTRATLSGLSTEFEADDTIGIFIANEDRTQYDNIPYVFDGTEWNLAKGEYIPKKVSFFDNYEYFAYYPYSKSFNGWWPYYYDRDEDGDCTADEFFYNFIRYWTPRADQSTKANFNASDLMAGKGTILSATTGTVSFTLNHKMGLVRIMFFDPNGIQIDNISNIGSVYFPEDKNPYIPFNSGQYFYCIVPPGREVPFLVVINEEQETITAADAGHVSNIAFDTP
jgi:hypothetical protein